MIRKAIEIDLSYIEKIYSQILSEEENGSIRTGWLRGIYPTINTADAALSRDDLFVLEEDGTILGSGIINQVQVDVYYDAPWRYTARDSEVCVLHTLVISPSAGGKGLGKAFVSYYEAYAANHGWLELRIDTNAINSRARAMYRQLGYTEIATVPTVFNGIPGVNLVLLEKHL